MKIRIARESSESLNRRNYASLVNYSLYLVSASTPLPLLQKGSKKLLASVTREYATVITKELRQ